MYLVVVKKPTLEHSGPFQTYASVSLKDDASAPSKSVQAMLEMTDDEVKTRKAVSARHLARKSGERTGYRPLETPGVWSLTGQHSTKEQPHVLFSMTCSQLIGRAFLNATRPTAW
jgi:hypothetical protein